MTAKKKADKGKKLKLKKDTVRKQQGALADKEVDAAAGGTLYVGGAIIAATGSCIGRSIVSGATATTQGGIV